MERNSKPDFFHTPQQKKKRKKKEKSTLSFCFHVFSQNIYFARRTVIQSLDKHLNIHEKNIRAPARLLCVTYA